jgi:nonsense-mediated mRNA decay protein 3
VFAGTILQQAFVVEYVIENFTCENCHRVAAKDTWQSVVQLRQKVRTFGSVLVSRVRHLTLTVPRLCQVNHKRTFFFLEQLILKHNAHEQVRPRHSFTHNSLPPFALCL